jgi:hypothetical protein
MRLVLGLESSPLDVCRASAKRCDDRGGMQGPLHLAMLAFENKTHKNFQFDKVRPNAQNRRITVLL